MELFVQRLADGLSNGAIYAALALALVLIYRSTGILNFAQGEMAMFSAFGVWFLHAAGLPTWIAVLVGLVGAFVVGALIELIVIRPVEKQDHLTIVIVTVGLFIGLNALAGYLFGYDGRRLSGLFPQGSIKVAGARINAENLGVLLVLLLVSGLMWLLFNRTGIGLALRAVASNATSSSLVGIPVSRMLMVGWGLGAMLGCLAGVLVTTSVFIEPNMMLGALVYAFAAALLGGLDSSVGAVIGGLIVGLTESLASGYISWVGSDLKLAIAFLLILGILMFKPSGLFGRPEVQRL